MNSTKILTLLSLVLFGACIGFFSSPKIFPHGESHSFSASEKEEIQQVVHDYLIKQPEVIVKAVEEYQKKYEGDQTETAKQTISQAPELILDPNSPILGNPQGTVTLVKFLDYQCPHCKSMEKVVEELIQTNPNLKVVIKEFPILGKDSTLAAKVALASARQGKFLEMHQALLNEKEHLTHEKIFDIAKQKGIDIQKLDKDLENKQILDEIENTIELAHKISIHGTPYFVLMGNLKNHTDNLIIIPGAATKDDLQAAIQEVSSRK